MCTRLLTKPLRTYELRVPNNVEQLKKLLHKGDVVLVEGDQRVSEVIRYVTQSSWSHSTLYVGDELLKDGSERAKELREGFGDDAGHLLIEALIGEGVVISPLGKYEPYNIRICRPQGLRREDVQTVLADAISHLGDRYDVKHVYDLARFFFPVSIVPKRWRRAALDLGSGSDREVICSSVVANAFRRVGYPILPEVTLDEGTALRPWWQRLFRRDGRWQLARFREEDPTLITPRDFDLSPYFEIVKFTHLADTKFDYRDIVWEETAETTDAAARKDLPEPPGEAGD